MYAETILRCGYCHKPIDPFEAVIYEDPATKKLRKFHPGECHNKARKYNKKYGIDSFKYTYSRGELDRFK